MDARPHSTVGAVHVYAVRGVSDDPSALINRAHALILAHPGGLTTARVAGALGCSPATAACTLARLYWRGAIDRREVSGSGSPRVYAPRTAHAPSGREVED